jgi:hypothetical protein
MSDAHQPFDRAMRRVEGRGGILAVVAASLSTSLSACGNLFDCYDATLVGTSTYYLIVAKKGKGKKHGIHSYASDFVYKELASWNRGDELVVCNAMVTNVTKTGVYPVVILAASRSGPKLGLHSGPLIGKRCFRVRLSRPSAPAGTRTMTVPIGLEHPPTLIDAVRQC